MYVDFGGDKISPRLPKGPQQRAGFIKKCLRNDPRLTSVSRDVREILSEARQCAKTRDDLVHGVVANPQSIGGKFLFAKMDYSDTGFSLRDVTVDPAEIADLNNRIVQLGYRTDTVTQNILDAR